MPIKVNLPNWQDQIHGVAIQFMNAIVQFYTTSKDPVGAPTEIILWTGKARVQQLRSPREGNLGYEQTSSRSFRFQLDPDDDIPFLKEGTLARVVDGGRDPDLEKLPFVVNSAINSSHRAVRTVELRAEMNPVEPQRVIGTVVDDEFEQPIEGVQVSIYDDNGVLIGVSITERYGRFWYYPTVVGNFELHFEHPDYSTVIVENVQISDEVFVEMVHNG